MLCKEDVSSTYVYVCGSMHCLPAVGKKRFVDVTRSCSMAECMYRNVGTENKKNEEFE